MPPRSAISSAPVSAIRATLEHMLTQPPGTESRIPCASVREAVSLRSRMNRLRATDRQQNVAVFAAANRQAIAQGLPHTPIPADANRSIFDDLIFRVEDSTVILQRAGMTAAELIALAGLPPMEGSLTPQPAFAPEAAQAPTVVGSFDTAPRSDEDPFA